jgi:molybdopterin-synthase adenylyltransferase
MTDRFARHRLIAGFSQHRVSELRIGLVGAGAIGNEMLKNLLLLGVAKVDVFDFDTVEISNLTRSLFLRESDVGTNKAIAVVRRAQELHPTTQLSAFAGPIDRQLGLSKFASYHMVIAAVDNLEARLRINDMALITKTPWMNIAIDHQNVVVEIFPQSSEFAACYACNLPDSAFERLARRLSCGGLQRAAALARTIPTTTMTASAASALASSELMRFLSVPSEKTDTPTSATNNTFNSYDRTHSQRIFLDTIAPSISRTRLKKADLERGCPGCGVHLAAPVNAAEKLGESLKQHSNEAAFLSDALIVHCACTACDAAPHNQPSMSAALLARASCYSDELQRCPQCHQDTVRIDLQESFSSAEFTKHFGASSPGKKLHPDAAWVCHAGAYFDLLH